MNMLSTDDVKWVEDKMDDIKKISSRLESAETLVVKAEKSGGALAKMKAFVRKAVDCCIE